MAFVVPASGQPVDIDELIAWSRENMANYKVPRYVELVDALPLNAAGKVLKYELVARGSDRAWRPAERERATHDAGAGVRLTA